MTLTLQTTKREKTGTSANESLRAAGKMPAVVYGPKSAAVPVVLNQTDFTKIWHEAGESTVVVLEGLDEEKEVLIHEVDTDPVSGAPRHVDFYEMEKGKKVTVTVPLEFVGESPAVKSLNATLVRVLYEVDVEAMPKNLPHELSVDVSALVDLDSHITVGDIKTPEGVEIVNDPEEIVATVEAEREEEPEEPAEEADLSSIEVEGESKEGDEDGEATSDESEEK